MRKHRTNTYYWLLLLLLLFLLPLVVGVETCGLKELTGGTNEHSQPAPCAERIPTPTAMPETTQTPDDGDDESDPEPSGTPLIAAGTPAPGVPTVEPPTPTPKPTPKPTSAPSCLAFGASCSASSQCCSGLGCCSSMLCVINTCCKLSGSWCSPASSADPSCCSGSCDTSNQCS